MTETPDQTTTAEDVVPGLIGGALGAALLGAGLGGIMIGALVGGALVAAFKDKKQQQPRP